MPLDMQPPLTARELVELNGRDLVAVTFDEDGVTLDLDGIELRLDATVTVAPPGDDVGLSLDVGTRQGRLLCAEALVGAIGQAVAGTDLDETGLAHLRLAGGTGLGIHP